MDKDDSDDATNDAENGNGNCTNISAASKICFLKHLDGIGSNDILSGENYKNTVDKN